MSKSMFDSQREIMNGGRTHKFRVIDDTRLLRYSDVIRLWRFDESFRSFFLSLLADVALPAYRWETPPVTAETLDRTFEFVVFESPVLVGTADPTAFADQFEGARSADGVVAFENLGKDALLVAPTPHGPASAYGHLAAFVRHAPQWQTHALWRLVGDALEQRIDRRPVWTSTAGGGVAWLHVRLDSRPKYYGFEAYKKLA